METYLQAKQTGLVLPLGWRPDLRSGPLFVDSQADAVVRVAGYHRRDFDMAVIWFSPQEIRSRVCVSIRRPPARGLGELNALPDELLIEVLLNLDMCSLFRFGGVNVRARQLVESLSGYRAVVANGLTAYCALLRTQLGARVTLRAFYDALATKACAHCGHFAGFMFLPTWTRVCFGCLETRDETRMQTQNWLVHHNDWRISNTALERLPSFRFIKGTYTLKQLPCKKPTRILPVQAAMALTGMSASHRAHTSTNFPVEWDKYRYVSACAMPYYDHATGRAERGLSCAGCQLALEKRTALVRSMGKKWALRQRDLMYDREGFLQHFRQCDQAQALWRSSFQGTVTPAELPDMARRGGFFATGG